MNKSHFKAIRARKTALSRRKPKKETNKQRKGFKLHKENKTENVLHCFTYQNKTTRMQEEENVGKLLVQF